MKTEYPIIASACLFLLPGCKNDKQKEIPCNKPNVLFICVDDLRRDLGCYGTKVISPNIDRLAEQGSLFFNHYVQVPTSGASRASMLTGTLPREKADLSNEACRTRLSGKPEVDTPETMFHHLKRNGYYTVGVGKISHYVDGLLYGYTDPVGNEPELPHSWNEMLFDAGKWETGWNAFFGYADGTNRQSRDKQVKPYECADVPDEGYPDGLTAKLAVEKLKEMADKSEPFCLAVGFFKPHLPFTAPKKYWDMYEEDEIPLSPISFIPEGCHSITLHESAEFNGYLLGEEKASLEKAVSDEYARKLRHAYYACISYVDAQIGKVLDALEESGQADNTIVILWGDHGWHLGDHLVWGKHTLHETSLGSTFIVSAPDKKKGVKNHRIVSSIDIYPTLMELCDVEIPDGLDGKSFMSLLDSPQDPTWNGALDYALKIQDEKLVKLLQDKFDPFFTREKALLPPMDHVDYNMFGSLALKLYQITNDKRYLDMGLAYADTQWEVPANAKAEEQTWAERGYSWQTRMWIDDMYMITVVQNKAYKVTGDPKYIDRAAKEMVLYLDELQRPNGLFYHAPDVPYYWARGDGWMAVGMADLLRDLPKDHKDYTRIMEGYLTMMKSLKNYQSPDGMWNQLINEPDFWPETSGTAMFTYAFIVGIQQGWLDATEYAPVARKAWLAMIPYIDERNNVTEVCIGTGKRDDKQYYYDRPRLAGDFHGQAPYLWCAAALLEKIRN